MRLTHLLMALGLVFLAANKVEAKTLEIYMVDQPPLAAEKGDRRGFVADIAVAAVTKAGYEPKIVFIPWRRAQLMVEEGEDLLITPFARIPEREQKFTWIAKVYDLERSFASLDKPIDSLDDAKKVTGGILVAQGTSQEAFLLKNGFDKSQLQSQPAGMHETEMLASGRVQAWFNGTPYTVWQWKQSGAKSKLLIGKPVTSDEVYLACSKKCSKEVVQSVASAVEQMKKNGEIDKVISSYLAQ
jgi:polar amino acid transport system substrate-binding protein